MSDELIPIEPREVGPGHTVQTVNARDIWRFTESKRSFSNWWKERSSKFGFELGRDYFTEKNVYQFAHKGGTRSATIQDFFLTIETAKEFMMLENNEKGREVRQYFIECERLALAAIQTTSVEETGKPTIDALLSDPRALMELLAKHGK